MPGVPGAPSGPVGPGSWKGVRGWVGELMGQSQQVKKRNAAGSPLRYWSRTARRGGQAGRRA